MPNIDWYIEGIEFGNCNCNYGCPCQFEDLPTHGNCRGFEVLQIARGHFGDVKLDGLRCAVLYAWPGPIFEGKGELQAIIDERASPDQRVALEKVLHGKETEEAKTHWWVYNAMSDTVHPTLFKPIDFEVDLQGRTAGVSIPDVLEATGRPIRSPRRGIRTTFRSRSRMASISRPPRSAAPRARQRRRSGSIWMIPMGSGTSCGTRASAWCMRRRGDTAASSFAACVAGERPSVLNQRAVDARSRSPGPPAGVTASCRCRGSRWRSSFASSTASLHGAISRLLLGCNNDGAAPRHTPPAA